MIYVFLANGFEEMEAMAPIDCLRRAGKQVVTVAVGGAAIRSSHGMHVIPDLTEQEITLDDSLEMIVLPGGMPGTLNLENSEQVQKAIAYCAAHDKWIAAICAAPSILGHLGMLDGKNATCFEGFEAQLKGANITGEPVCVDGRIITARGAGVALQFGLKLTQLLCGDAAYKKLHDSMLCE